MAFHGNKHHIHIVHFAVEIIGLRNIYFAFGVVAGSVIVHVVKQTFIYLAD